MQPGGEYQHGGEMGIGQHMCHFGQHQRRHAECHQQRDARERVLGDDDHAEREPAPEQRDVQAEERCGIGSRLEQQRPQRDHRDGRPIAEPAASRLP
jgi:hypothetical protein